MPITLYPDWLLKIVRPGELYADDRKLMEITLRVGLANIANTLGGPFSALIAAEGGRVIAIGCNEVVPARDSTAHAEIMAIRRAEQAFGAFKLRGDGLPRLKLFTSCAPCIMCAGAIHWAGIPAVIAAARAEDAEALGFVERPMGFDAEAFLAERGIAYRGDLLRDEAQALFREYRGLIYNG